MCLYCGLARRPDVDRPFVMTDDDIRHIIQDGLRQARSLHPSLYGPSPGQTPSHVDHRVMCAVMQILEDNGLMIVPSEPSKSIEAFRRREWLAHD